MSLFQHGFHRVSASTSGEQPPSAVSLPSHIPTAEESGLGRAEYESVIGRDVAELSDRSPAAKRRERGKYTMYTAEDRAKIGKYALEHGNEKARRRFLTQFPNLKESTVRNFKWAYKDQLHVQRKQLHPQPVTTLPSKPRGWPPALLELDEKLIKFLRALRSKGGVINIHVVRATATTLISSNPSTSLNLQNISMPRTWVQSVYRLYQKDGNYCTTSSSQRVIWWMQVLISARYWEQKSKVQYSTTTYPECWSNTFFIRVSRKVYNGWTQSQVCSNQGLVW